MSQNSHQKKPPILIEPHYFGSIHYHARLLQPENLIFETSENYQKGSYRNRSYISGPNGPILLSIPLQKGKNEQQPLKEVKISYTDDWRRQHRQSIISTYNRTPFFEFIADDVFGLYEKQYDFLVDFTIASCKLFSHYVKSVNLHTQTDTYEQQPQDIIDFRNRIHPKKHKTAEDTQFRHPRYHQVFQEKTGFIENLSILDLYAMEGPNSHSILKNSILPDKNASI